MTEHEHPTSWAETALRYLDAVDAGAVETLADLWKKAESDAQLEQVLGELTDGLAVLEGPIPTFETDADNVRKLLRKHLPSGSRTELVLPPLTVRDVAARLQSDSALGTRWSTADRVANSRLLADATPVPSELGLPQFEKWRTTLGVSASSSYWRAFRQAAVLLAMGRCQRAGELAAARRASQGPRGGRA